MTTFFLIRHALTDSVTKQILAGRAPNVFLNETGREQAQKLAQKFDGFPVQAIYCSPLERAFETAEMIAAKLNLRVRREEFCNEIEFGAWTGKTFAELENDALWKRFNSFRGSVQIPYGETMLQVQARVIAGLEKLRERHFDQSVVVVSHADLIKASIAHYAGIALDQLGRLEISPASVSIVSVGADRVQITALNHVGGLENYQELIGR